MRRDLIIAFLIVLGVHIGVALVPKHGAKRKQVDDDAPVVKIVIPPLPPPEDEPVKNNEPTETPVVSPPALADIPTVVPVDAFVTPIEPPRPPSLNVSSSTVAVPRADLTNVKIFDLADLDQPPMARLQMPPSYPADMNRSGTTGTVQVGFICDAGGHVQDAYVITSSGSSELDQAAVAGVSRWLFKPGRRDGRAVNVRMEIPIAFNLDSQ